MNPRRLFVVTALAMTMACNLILAIDGDVIDPVDSSSPDSSDGGVDVGEASSLEYAVSPERLRLRQSERARLEVLAKAVAPGSTASFSVDRLPKGVTVTPSSLSITGPGSKSFDVVVDTFAPPVVEIDARVLVEHSGKLEGIKLLVDISGPVDLTFGTGGITTLGFALPKSAPTLKDPEGADWHGVGLLVPASQKLVVAFSAGVAGTPSFSRARIVRVMPNGALDPSYGVNGWRELAANTRAHDIGFLPNGSTLLVGGFSNDAGAQSTAVVHSENGGPAGASSFSSFGDGGSNQGMRSVSMDPDGGAFGLGIGASAQYTSYLETPPLHDAGVGLDPDFRAYDLIRGSADTILVGKTTAAEGAAVRRFRDGTTDTSWGQNGRVVLSGAVSTLRAGAAADGGFVFGGSITRDGSAAPVGLQLVRTDVTGLVDVSFGDAGLVEVRPRDGATLAEIDVVLVEPDGHVMAGGHVDIGSRRLGFMARFTANGSIDGAFGADGFLLVDVGAGTNAEVRRLGLQGTAIVAAILTTSSAGTRDVALVRIKP